VGPPRPPPSKSAPGLSLTPNQAGANRTVWCGVFILRRLGFSGRLNDQHADVCAQLSCLALAVKTPGGGHAALDLTLPAQTFTTLHSFAGADGAYPQSGALVQATDGDLYGTTAGGGAYTCADSDHTGCGTVFKITPSGTLTALYSFCAQGGCADGYNPFAGLIHVTSGELYGMSQAPVRFLRLVIGSVLGVHTGAVIGGINPVFYPAGTDSIVGSRTLSFSGNCIGR
jgi:uncharacterized repeat protein (TIGR03803 family)